MKIGFIENETRLVSSGACNLMMSWYELIAKAGEHQVCLLQWSDKDTDGDGTYSGQVVRMCNKDRAVLEEYDMLIVNNLGEPSEEFYDVLKSCKRPVTIFVYHDRTVIRDIFTEPELMNYINACDYVLTYQPKFLEEKMGINKDKILPMDFTSFYKNPIDYSKKQLPKIERPIQMLYCNRTNNFKGARYFMEWCRYLRNKGGKNIRVMKGFHPDYPHQDLPNYKHADFNKLDLDGIHPENYDFFTENYGPHSDCLDLMSLSKFVWLAQDYSKFDPEKFKDGKEYESYLNYDPDGTTLEAMFSGCIPIMHINNLRYSSFFKDVKKACIFYDPDKGFSDLYSQMLKALFNITKINRTLKDIRALYEQNLVFYTGLMLSITPPTVFDYYKELAKTTSN